MTSVDKSRTPTRRRTPSALDLARAETVLGIIRSRENRGLWLGIAAEEPGISNRRSNPAAEDTGLSASQLDRAIALLVERGDVKLEPCEGGGVWVSLAPSDDGGGAEP
jgi:hypothetical protein